MLLTHSLLKPKNWSLTGVDVSKKLIELSNKVESQQKQIDELTKELLELKK